MFSGIHNITKTIPGSTNWANQLNALNVPITGICNATDGNCPEYTGKITASGGTVTFTLTEGMDWRQNPPVHVTLATPIVFTAANWVTNMTDGSGWNRGMHFWIQTQTNDTILDIPLFKILLRILMQML